MRPGRMGFPVKAGVCMKDGMTEPKDMDVASLKSLTADQKATLHSFWITGARQLCVAASSPEGAAGLARLLNAGEGAEALAPVLAELREILGADEVEVLSKRQPGGKLGARLADGKEVES